MGTNRCRAPFRAGHLRGVEARVTRRDLIQSVANVVDTAPNDIDIMLVTRDSDLGSSEPYGELSGQCVPGGPARVFYLARGDRTRVGDRTHPACPHAYSTISNAVDGGQLSWCCPDRSGSGNDQALMIGGDQEHASMERYRDGHGRFKWAPLAPRC